VDKKECFVTGFNFILYAPQMQAAIIMLQTPNKRHSGIQLVFCYNNGYDARLNIPFECNVVLLLLPVYDT
jgi:hypothetical protein